MRDLSKDEVTQVSGGGLSFNEGAGLILAVGAMGGPATFAFAAPIALSLYWLSN
ncbi:hypothetical protein N9740_06130 [Pseudomonadales bacterium]|nr:hypothetical protein [Pseudomonadales bacterium]MDB4151059.1 hypothetical protein [Pseudomonadales bacterium]